MSSPLVEVPAAVVGSWHDAIPTIAAAALGQLRLGSTDHDAERVAAEAPTACSSIDSYLDLRPTAGRVTYTTGGGIVVVSYASGDAPPDVYRAAILLTVELYGRKDARFGVLGQATDVPVRISADHMRGVASLLDPYREGFGIG